MRRRTALELATTGMLGIAGCLGDGPDGSTNGDEIVEALYTVSVAIVEETSAEELSLELGFDVRRETITEDDPFGIGFELRNEGEEPVEVSSGAPWPFGVIRMDREGSHDEPGITLWTDAYEESSHVRTEGRRVTEVQEIGLIEELDGGASVSETYELHRDTSGLKPGTYRVRLGVGARSGDVSESVSTAFEFTVADGSEATG